MLLKSAGKAAPKAISQVDEGLSSIAKPLGLEEAVEKISQSEQLRSNLVPRGRYIGKPPEVVEDTSETVIDEGLSSLSPELLKVSKNLPLQEAAQKTQIGTTTGTYVKAKNILDEVGDETILDYGAGLGKGAAKIKADTYEPFPKEGFNPTFTQSKNIPSNSRSRMTNLNVLNVVPPNVRKGIIQDIGRILKDDGKAVITTRTWKGDVDKTLRLGTKGPEPQSVITSTGTYQRGFTTSQLKKEIEDILNVDDKVTFKVEPNKLGGAGVTITKKIKSLTDIPLKNPKGSVVRRGSKKYPVGKVIGGQVYFHKNYISKMPKEVIDIYKKTINKLPKDHSFNTLMYTPASKGKPASLRFDEAPDFDTAREPIPGRVITITEKGSISPPKDVNQIWHHKWSWVDDDYKGFDVRENYDWSREWFTNKGVKASGSPVKWQEALKEVKLKKKGGMVARNPYPEARGIY